MLTPFYTETDVLIVGAGPAGTTLAAKLAAAGRETLIIDKADFFPRHKPCGGGLSPRAMRLLPAEARHMADGEVKSVAIDGAWTGRFRYATEKTLVVDRARFDKYLLDRAIMAGAKFEPRREFHRLKREGADYLIETRAGTKIRACVLCACDGAFSPTAFALGVPKAPLGFCVEAVMPMSRDLRRESRYQAIFNPTIVEKGYAWAFPRHMARCYNVGIGVARAKMPELKDYLYRFIRKTRELRGKDPGKLRGGMLPIFDRPLTWYARDNAYLLGDAARLADPLTGEGIYHAILSAGFAAEAILAPSGGEALYQELVEHEIVAELNIARRAANRLQGCSPLFLAFMMSLPPLRAKGNLFVDTLSGRLSYRELYRETHGGRNPAS